MHLLKINICSIKQVREQQINYAVPANIAVTDPSIVMDIVNTAFDVSNADREYLGVIVLDTKNKIAGVHIVSMGTLSASVAHPREIFKLAVLNNAAGIILWHNHPSGDVAPSKEDLTLTDRIKAAGELMGIALIDHIIVGAGTYYSFRQEGGL